jgi:Eukaryotic protein of unknown function (DUF829)
MATSKISNGGSHQNSIVVLAGWLGSQPKSLRRYENLYRNLGVPVVLTHIAPPFAIVRTVLQVPPVQPIQVPHRWPSQHRRVAGVQDVAWNILKDLHDESSRTSIYMHVFSNGGCFVWEQIREILSLSLRQSNHQLNESESKYTAGDTPVLSLEVADILSKLRQQLAGIVFDSCPVADLHRLPDALRYCSWTERLNVVRYCGLNHMFIQGDAKVYDRVKNRVVAYVSGLVSDPLQIPQLYVYGRDDPLVPASFIDEIVQERKRRMGSDRVLSICWDHSLHCGHLLKHPEEYSTVIKSLLTYESKGNLMYHSKL